METNEQGLTKEEKIMFSILGIILIVAIGVLIINSFSANERKLEDSKTPITETQGQKEDKVEDETTTNKQEESLIEDDPVEKVVINKVVSNKPSTKPTQTVVKPIEPEKEENLGTGNTDIPGIIEWSFKDNMITEAYSNDIIIIDRNIILSTGEEVEAVVTVRKLEDNSWNIVDISSNELIVTEGLYKYYYTYGNQTKELLLTVKNKLEIEKLEFLTLDEVYEEESSITEEEFTLYQNTLLNSTLTTEDNKYTLTIKSENQNTIIPIVVTITEELLEPIVTSSTLGVIPSIENNDWYQELSNKELILWIDTNIIDITNPEINLNINGTNYYFDLNIVISEETEEQPEIEEDKNVSNEENTDNEEIKDSEEENNNNEENVNEEDEDETLQKVEEETEEIDQTLEDEEDPEKTVPTLEDEQSKQEQPEYDDNDLNGENLNNVLNNSEQPEIETS